MKNRRDRNCRNAVVTPAGAQCSRMALSLAAVIGWPLHSTPPSSSATPPSIAAFKLSGQSITGGNDLPVGPHRRSAAVRDKPFRCSSALRQRVVPIITAEISAGLTCDSTSTCETDSQTPVVTSAVVATLQHVYDPDSRAWPVSTALLTSSWLVYLLFRPALQLYWPFRYRKRHIRHAGHLRYRNPTPRPPGTVEPRLNLAQAAPQNHHRDRHVRRISGKSESPIQSG